MPSTSSGAGAAGLVHEALPFDGRAAFVAQCSAAVRDGLSADDRLIVLAPAALLDELRDELGTDADDAAFVPTDEHGRNPGRILTLLHTFSTAGDGRHATGVHVPSVLGRSPAALAEFWLADQLLNLPPLATWPLRIICLFDTDDLDAAGQTEMRRSHAVVRGLPGNPDYDPDCAGTTYALPLDAPPPDCTPQHVVGPDLGQLREFVRARSLGFGLSLERADDLVLAVNEIVTNSLRYGGGRAIVGVWLADGAVVCDVRDRGHIVDQLTGRFAPAPAAVSGRGIWLANHLCDLVQLRSSAAGTVVRMHVDTPR